MAQNNQGRTDATVEALRAEVATLSAQLKAKDRQILAALELAASAQRTAESTSDALCSSLVRDC